MKNTTFEFICGFIILVSGFLALFILMETKIVFVFIFSVIGLLLMLDSDNRRLESKIKTNIRKKRKKNRRETKWQL